MPAVFLTLDEVLALHADQIERYGGRLGLRDAGRLEAALAMPAANFGGEYLHASLPEMASAYLFHIVTNHPFLDGNKRAGLVAMLAFLGLNGLRLRVDSEAVVNLVVGIAAGRIGKAEAAVFVGRHARPRRRD